MHGQFSSLGCLLPANQPTPRSIDYINQLVCAEGMQINFSYYGKKIKLGRFSLPRPYPGHAWNRHSPVCYWLPLTSELSFHMTLSCEPPSPAQATGHSNHTHVFYFLSLEMSRCPGCCSLCLHIGSIPRTHLSIFPGMVSPLF